MPNTIEQFRSRIRFFEDCPYHLDMLFKVMTKNSSLSKIKGIKRYLQRYEEVYKTYVTFEEILKNNPKQNFKTTIGKKEEEDYEQYNVITKQFKLDQLAFYEELYHSDDLLEAYKNKLQQMYPYVEVATLQDLKLEKYSSDLMGNNKEIILKENKDDFREKMKNLGVGKAHKNTLPSLKIINKMVGNLGYKLTNDVRIYVAEEKKHKRIWKLQKDC